jgi:hypothetical protein
MMDSVIMTKPKQDDEASAEASPLPKPKNPNRRGRWTGPTAYTIIRDHLEQHGSITPDEANDLHGISHGSFNSTICLLRRDGFDITTSRYHNDFGQMRSRYHLAADDEDAAPPPMPPSMKSHTVAVRIGEDGLEVQLAPDNDVEGTPFFRLTPKQIEYLVSNFKLYQALCGEKEKQ